MDREGNYVVRSQSPEALRLRASRLHFDHYNAATGTSAQLRNTPVMPSGSFGDGAT